MADPARRAQVEGTTWILNRFIRHWPGLAPTVKDVWTELWTIAGGQAGTISVTTGGIADRTGFNDRPVRRSLGVLKAIGAVTILDSPAKGPMTIYMADPGEIARGRIVSSDPQRELFRVDPPPDAEVPAKVVPFWPEEESADAAPQRPSQQSCDQLPGWDQLSPQLQGKLATVLSKLEPSPGMQAESAELPAHACDNANANANVSEGAGESASSGADSPAPVIANDQPREDSQPDPGAHAAEGGIAAVFADCKGGTLAEKKKALRDYIRATVDDAGMPAYVDGVVADMLLDEATSSDAVDEILQRIQRKRGDGSLRSAGAYCNFAARKLAEESGFPWPVKSKGNAS